MHEEPRVVDLDDILRDASVERTAVTPVQWVVVVVGGLIGLAGSLAVLVAAIPVVLDVARWIDSINDAVNGL
jgi:hypothetical protein